MNAVQSKGLSVDGTKEPDVNGLPLSLVDQWQEWQYVYADHLCFLTRKRHRVDGVRFQGYTTAGLIVKVIA
ncbi:hypothetical protein CBH90_08710 [Salmonella enterica]|nr:hypothetical protein [Salmonella enterica]